MLQLSSKHEVSSQECEESVYFAILEKCYLRYASVFMLKYFKLKIIIYCIFFFKHKTSDSKYAQLLYNNGQY